MARPNLSYLKNLILAAFGIPCGVLTGATGLSPAPILLPALRFLLGLNGPALNGVVLVMVSFAAWSSLVSFGQTNHVLWADGFLITLGTFAGAALAARAIIKAPAFFVRIRSFWAVIPLILALLMIAQSLNLVAHATPDSSFLPVRGVYVNLLWSFLIGAAVGFIGFAGELGSILTVPLLIFLLGRSVLDAEGTALYVLILASLPTAMLHVLRRSVDLNAALSLSLGGILGALFGSHIAVTGLTEGSLLFLTGGTLVVYALISAFQPQAALPSAKR